MNNASYSILVVCEASADQATACDLADRIVCESVDWIEPDQLDDFRRWRGSQEADTHLTWKAVALVADKHGTPTPHGHFKGEPQAHDEATALRALWLAKSLEPTPDGVILIRDIDEDVDRVRGLERARTRSQLKHIAIGVAHTERECWVLNGFEARDQAEERRLSTVKQELGFDPTIHGSRLTAQRDQHKRSAKRVLQHLTDGSIPRQQSCWRETTLATLRERGTHSGLTAYLEDVTENIVSLFTPKRSARG